MDGRKRIEDLEQQVEVLTHELQALRAREAAAVRAPRDRAATGLALLLAAGAAAGMWALMRTPALDAVERVAVAYGAALAAIAYAFLHRKESRRVDHGFLGAGLGIFYFTLFGSFYVPALRVFSPTVPPMPVLLGCFVALLVVVHVRRSAMAAAVALGSVYVTAVWPTEAALAHPTYAPVIGVACAAAALLLHAQHRWMFVSWVALVGTYALFAIRAPAEPQALGLTPERYLVTGLAFLSAVFLVFSTVSIVDLLERRLRQRPIAALALLNLAAFYVLMRLLLAGHPATYVLVFHLACAAVLAVLAAVAAGVAGGRNRLTEVFLAGAVLALGAALRSVLSGALEWVVVAVACLVLAGFYARTRVVLTKAANLAALLILFVMAFWAVNGSERFVAAGYSWDGTALATGGVALLLIACAALYDGLARREPRARMGRRWLLEGTRWDVRHAHAALLHGGTAAYVVLMALVFRLGDRPELPYVLGLAAMAALVVGYGLRAPSVRAGGLALLVAAHGVYYFMRYVPSEHHQAGAVPFAYALLLGLATLAGAFAWEQQTKAYAGLAAGGYDFLSAIPYALGVAYLTDVTAHRFGGFAGPVVLDAMGLVLLGAALLTAYSGPRMAGMLGVAAGTGLFLARLLQTPPFGDYERFLPWLAAAAMACAAGERLLAWKAARSHAPSDVDEAVRSLLTLAAATVGVAGIYAALPKGQLAIALLVLGAPFLGLGLILSDRRYLWPSFLILALGIIRGAFYDLNSLTTGQILLAMALFSGILLALVIAWLLKRIRARRAAEPVPSPTPTQRTPDERTA